MSTIAYRFDVSYAGITLEMVTFQEQIGRTVIQHRPTRGDGAQLSDRGRVPRMFSVSVQITGTAEEVSEKRASLVGLSASNETRIFSHPLDGNIQCKLEEFTGGWSPGEVTYTLQLIEDLDFARRFEDTAQLQDGTFQDIAISAEELEATTASLLTLDPELAATVPDSASIVESARTWRETGSDQIVSAVEGFRDGAEASQFALDGDSLLEAFQASIALEALRGSVERFAAVAQRLTPSVFDLRVGLSQPLIVLLSSVYGARLGESLFDEVARTNSVPNVRRLRAGQVLQLPLTEVTNNGERGMR